MASDRVAAVLIDIDSAGEGLIMGLYVQSSLSSVQSVLLDEIHVLHSCHLNTESCVIITTQVPNIGQFYWLIVMCSCKNDISVSIYYISCRPRTKMKIV